MTYEEYKNKRQIIVIDTFHQESGIIWTFITNETINYFKIKKVIGIPKTLLGTVLRFSRTENVLSLTYKEGDIHSHIGRVYITLNFKNREEEVCLLMKLT
jgi:hypothetical protein